MDASARHNNLFKYLTLLWPWFWISDPRPWYRIYIYVILLKSVKPYTWSDGCGVASAVLHASACHGSCMSYFDFDSREAANDPRGMNWFCYLCSGCGCWGLQIVWRHQSCSGQRILSPSSHSTFTNLLADQTSTPPRAAELKCAFNNNKDNNIPRSPG